MSKEETNNDIHLAQALSRQFGITVFSVHAKRIVGVLRQHFTQGYELGAIAGREECAKLCDERETDEAFVKNIADAIRARNAV